MRPALLTLSLLLLGSAAEAQPRRAAILFAEEGEPARRATWQVHVERAARVAGYVVVGDAAAWATERAADLGPVAPRRVEAFRTVEALLVEARQAAATLREGEALALLVRAERIARDHADVPGAAAWLAEVETAVGITAAQAGIPTLVEAALSRAATLDPSRGVRAAEAPPAIVARAEAIARAVATRPTGTFEVRADADGARVFLDDEDLGTAPRPVRAPVGLHVLRVEAPGRLPWGRAVRVFEGRRPPVEVRLAPDPLLAAARRLRHAAGAADPEAVAAALGVLAGLDAAWIVQVGDGAQDRALLTPCDGSGCAEPRRLEVDEVPIVVGDHAPSPAGRVRAALVAGRSWLLEPAPEVPPPPPPAPWWQRWYTWAGAAVLAGAAVGAAVWLTRPDPAQEHVYVVDFGNIGDP